jgi:hypothetical protein
MSTKISIVELAVHSMLNISRRRYVGTERATWGLGLYRGLDDDVYMPLNLNVYLRQNERPVYKDR